MVRTLKIRLFTLIFQGTSSARLALSDVSGLLRRHPAVAAEHRGRVTHFDLESAEDLARLADPALALTQLSGQVVIDEIQRLPGLFQTRRVLADPPRIRSRFLLLGSASPGLLRQSAESLTGPIAYYELGGCMLEEVGSRHNSKLWLRGALPRAGVELTGIRARFWGGRHDRSRILGHFVSGLGGSPASSLAREFVQAASKVTKNLRHGQRRVTCTTWSRKPERCRGASKGWCFLGGVRAGSACAPPQSDARRVLFLGNARWRRTGLAYCSRPLPNRV